MSTIGFFIDSVYFVFLDDTILILHRYELYTSQYCSCCHRNDDLYFISLSLSLARHIKKAFWVVVWFSVFSDLTYSNLLNFHSRQYTHSTLLYSTRPLCFKCYHNLWFVTVLNWMIIVDLNTHVMLYLIWYYHDNMILMCVLNDFHSHICEVPCLTILLYLQWLCSH